MTLEKSRADISQCLDETVDIFLSVVGHEREAKTALAFGYRRRPDAAEVDPFLEEMVRNRHRTHRVADQYGDDLGSGVHEIEIEGFQCVMDGSDVSPEPVSQVGTRFDESQGAEAPRMRRAAVAEV